MRTIQSLDIRAIAPRPTPIRPVDDDYATAIAASIAEAGQLQPVLVRPRAGVGGPAYELVCGGHRLRAAQLAGLAHIDAEVRNLTDVEARIAEIDENAVRNELSALDFALSMAERKRLYEAAHPEAAHGKKKGKSNQYQWKEANLATFHSFAKDAAKKTGFSDRSIRRATELATALAPDVVDLLRATKVADNAAALKRLSLLPADQRRAVAEALAAGEATSISGALAVRGFVEPAAADPAMALTARFADLLSRSNAAQRRDWLRLLMRAVRPAELPALANELADRLPTKGKKLVLDALTAVASAENEEAA